MLCNFSVYVLLLDTPITNNSVDEFDDGMSILHILILIILIIIIILTKILLIILIIILLIIITITVIFKKN